MLIKKTRNHHNTTRGLRAMRKFEQSTLLYNADVLDSINSSRDEYRKIIRALIAQGIKNLKDGQLEITSVDDLERLIKLDLELQKDKLIL